MEKAWSLALWSVLVCRIAIITDNGKGDGTDRVSSVETMHERRYTVDDWRYDTAHREQTENGQKG